MYKVRRLSGFGAFGDFTKDDQKAVCEANAPSGAYWNQSLDMCSGLTQDGAMMMCTASGGTWDVNQGCMCNGQPNIDANLIGCPAATGQAPLPAPQVPKKMLSATAFKKVVAKKATVISSGGGGQNSGGGGGGSGGGGGGGGGAVVVPASTFPWMWVAGGVAVVGLGAAAYFLTR